MALLQSVLDWLGLSELLSESFLRYLLLPTLGLLAGAGRSMTYHPTRAPEVEVIVAGLIVGVVLQLISLAVLSRSGHDRDFKTSGH